MAYYRPKKDIIEAYTFYEFVDYGFDNTKNIVNNMPWSFDFKGHQATHENDLCYLIGNLRFTPQKVLIYCEDGSISLYNHDEFFKKYERIAGQ